MRAKSALLLVLAVLFSSTVSAVTPQSGLWTIDAEQNGQPGRGMQIDVQNGALVLTFYGYRADGTAQWYLSAGPLGTSSYSGPLDQYAGGTAFGAAGSANAAFDALLQQRDVQVQRFDAKDYLAKVNPSDDDLQAYYKAPENAAQFQAPEQASVEYLVLDLDGILKGITINEADLKTYYEQNAARLSGKEERRASHILITSPASAPAAEREKARARAQELLAAARKAPDSFADLARKNSQDPGSATNGGDLDFAAPGAYVPEFSQAMVKLKKGEMTQVPVKTQFGFHIIRLDDTREAQFPEFDAVKGQLQQGIAQQKLKKFQEDLLKSAKTDYKFAGQ